MSGAQQALLASGAGEIRIDAVSSDTGFGTSLTWEHTCSGYNRALRVAISMKEDAAAVDTVTYNGDALTFVDSAEIAVTNGNLRVELWEMVNPDVGAHDVVATLDGVTDTQIVGGAISFIAAHHDLAELSGTPAKATGTSTTPTVNAASNAREIVMDVVANETGALTVGAGQTQRWNEGATEGAGSTEQGAATTTMSWSSTLSTKWAILAVPIRPAS